MSDTVTVYCTRWDALEALALIVGQWALEMPPCTPDGYRLLAHQAAATREAWWDVVRAPHMAAQPRLFDVTEAA